MIEVCSAQAANAVFDVTLIEAIDELIDGRHHVGTLVGRGGCCDQ